MTASLFDLLELVVSLDELLDEGLPSLRVCEHRPQSRPDLTS